MPEVHLLCYVCGNIAEHTCRMCGRPVCSKHFISKSGLCHACARGKGIGHMR